jgi:hypothetical protein
MATVVLVVVMVLVLQVEVVVEVVLVLHQPVAPVVLYKELLQPVVDLGQLGRVGLQEPVIMLRVVEVTVIMVVGVALVTEALAHLVQMVVVGVLDI